MNPSHKTDAIPKAIPMPTLDQEKVFISRVKSFIRCILKVIDTYAPSET
jgi:hypothetical protein